MVTPRVNEYQRCDGSRTPCLNHPSPSPTNADPDTVFVVQSALLLQAHLGGHLSTARVITPRGPAQGR